MKQVLVTLLAVFALSNVNAQSFSAGIRTGLGKSSNITEFCKGNNNLTWDKELYGRYQTNGKLAFESRFSHYSYNQNTPAPIEYYYEQPSFLRNDGSTLTNSYILGLSAQYNITCSYMKERCPIMKNISSFIGVDVAGVFNNQQYNYTATRTIDNAQIQMSETSSNYNILVGLSHTTIYNLTDKININGTARFMMQPSDFVNANSMGSHISFLVGIGYLF